MFYYVGIHSLSGAFMDFISFRKGYKYQLAESYSVEVGICVSEQIKTEFISLSTKGELLINSGYAWDGPSGPTIDTMSTMRPSLVHDALYQLIRAGELQLSRRKVADDIFYKLCLEDGMWRFRAWLWHRELRRFAGSAASPKNVKRVHIAPKKKVRIK